MTLPKVSMTVVASIMVAGIALNIAGSGMLGSTVQKGAKFITEGYGV